MNLLRIDDIVVQLSGNRVVGGVRTWRVLAVDRKAKTDTTRRVRRIHVDSVILGNLNRSDPAMATHACMLQKSDNAVLVRADAGQVLQLGESVYFHPECIDHTRFEVSDRIYTCPEKGTCFWVDLKTDKGFLNDVAWVYPETKQGFEHIAGWYGFYTHHRYYYYAECD